MKKSLIVNIAQLATPEGRQAVAGKAMNTLKIIENAAVYIEDGIIKKVGTQKEILNAFVTEGMDMSDIRFISAEGHAVIPGFVDSHTHFIFGGYREEEFINRLSGMEYMEIMRRGGGIQSTVQATREASREDLYDRGMNRLRSMLSQGITTVEGKSGYGLDRECEMKQLSVMHELEDSQPIDIVKTYLGGHASSDLFENDNGRYIDFMINEVMPCVVENGVAEFCDVFCEDSVFSIEESKKLLCAARDMGFKLKIHADEIVSLGGAELAGALHATSADHLLMVSDAGIDALRDNGVIATLLPCTAFCLNKPFAPARKMIDSGCAVALASDLNPGSCFANSIALMLALAVIRMNMSIEEAVTALTLNGAAAVDRADMIGSIEVGKRADMVVLDYPSYKFLVYHTGTNIVSKVIKEGEVVYEDPVCK
ncbi:MAG: imidazolonepropionase [Wujia sp.]